MMTNTGSHRDRKERVCLAPRTPPAAANLRQKRLVFAVAYREPGITHFTSFFDASPFSFEFCSCFH